MSKFSFRPIATIYETPIHDDDVTLRDCIQYITTSAKGINEWKITITSRRNPNWEHYLFGTKDKIEDPLPADSLLNRHVDSFKCERPIGFGLTQPDLFYIIISNE